MPTNIIMKIMPGGCIAANAIEAEKLEQFQGQELQVSISKPRNLDFHRKWFALLGVARDMADTDLNAEQFRAYVTVGAGHCEFIPDSEDSENNWRLIAIPKSIKFSAMDNSEFERLYQDALTFICQKWVLDEDQLNQIVGFM